MNDYPHDMAASYALDALDEQERAGFELHLQQCEACRAEVAELRSVVDILPLALDDLQIPSPHLRSRILAAVGEDAEPAAELPPPRLLRPTRAWYQRLEPYLAAAAILVIAVLGIWNLRLQSHAPSPTASERTVIAALASGASVSYLKGPGGTAAVVQPRDGRAAYLVLNGLHPLPRSRVYQLWFIAGNRPVSAGVFTVPSPQTSTVTAQLPAGGYSLAAVTVEPGPHGSPQPTGQKVLIGRLRT